MRLDLRLGDIPQMRPVRGLCTVLRILVDVQQNNRLTKSRFVVDAWTAIAVTAGPDFEVKGAIDFILFRSENTRQIFRHYY